MTYEFDKEIGKNCLMNGVKCKTDQEENKDVPKSEDHAL